MHAASLPRLVLFQIVTLLSLSACTVFAVAARIPANLNENVLTCGTNTRCTNKKMFGRNYKVIDSSRFTVMVSISKEGPYTRADVSIANHALYTQIVSPEDFRVEVLSPKPKVLPYVAPAELQNLPEPVRKPQAMSATFQGDSVVAIARTVRAAHVEAGIATSPTIDELYEAAKTRAALKEAAEKEVAQRHLAASAIPAHDEIQGKVYFERDPKAKQVNVILPVSGLVFQFPYVLAE